MWTRQRAVAHQCVYAPALQQYNLAAAQDKVEDYGLVLQQYNSAAAQDKVEDYGLVNTHTMYSGFERITSSPGSMYTGRAALSVRTALSCRSAGCQLLPPTTTFCDSTAITPSRVSLQMHSTCQYETRAQWSLPAKDVGS